MRHRKQQEKSCHFLKTGMPETSRPNKGVFTMKRITLLAVFFAFIFGGLMLPSLVFSQALNEPWGVYEDWSGKLIRPARWSGRNDMGLEVKREIIKIKAPRIHHPERGELVMRYRVVGSKASNTGFTGGANRLNARNAAQVNQLETNFKIKHYTLTGCTENAGTIRNFPAVLTLTKFNDGSSVGPGDSTGDHLARIIVGRDLTSLDPVGVFRVSAFLFRCVDAQCTNAISNIKLDMGTVEAGEWFTLRAVWDEPNNCFLVGLNNEPDLVLPYNPALNAREAVMPGADIRMQMVAGNCMDGSTETDAETLVGKVRTNQSAVIP